MPESFEPLRPESLEPLRTVSALGIPDDMLKIVCLVYEIDLGVDVSKEGVAKYEIGVVTLLPKVIFLADEDVEVEAEDVFCRDLASEERIKYYVLECDDDLGRNVDEGIDSMGLRKRHGYPPLQIRSIPPVNNQCIGIHALEFDKRSICRFSTIGPRSRKR